MLHVLLVFLALVLGAPLAGCGSDPVVIVTQPQPRGVVYTETREPCSQYNPRRNLYFGDLHAHSRYSHDAWIWDIRLGQEDGYAFAQGAATLLLPPLDENGIGTRTLQIDRPLDFAAFADHSEFLAEVQACATPGSAAYDSLTCVLFRLQNGLSTIVISHQLSFPEPQRAQDICGPGGVDCPELARSVWEEMQAAAEGAYDRTSACGFTSFLEYEYTATTIARNLHRNVLFRNGSVPDLPTSYMEAPAADKLWDELESTCQEGKENCDMLVIPHNSDESNGNKFAISYPPGSTLEEQRQLACRRVGMEPLVEIFQHKGDSECMNGLSGVPGEPDPLCDFEKIRQPPIDDCGDGGGAGGVMGMGCVSRLDYVRNVLLLGLAEEERLGVNPYKLGFFSSTDTHNVSPGAVAEDGYIGHLSLDDATVERRFNANGLKNSSGGLTGAWAMENSRDALFEAFRRRETFATSGPRIRVRFFGGWGYPDNLCGQPGFVQTGYAQGVPMGGDLPAYPGNAVAPRFAVQASMDPGYAGRPGTPLQRIQIIKGWIAQGGQPMLKVFEIAGNPANGAGVEVDTCETSGDGFENLCTVWTDPEFLPGERAFYYTRVVENPSCRWTAYECNRLAPEQRPESCSDPATAKVIQERAWTSPIWYSP